MSFFRRKYRFSQYRYTIPIRKFEIRIRSEKSHIVYKNHLESPKGRFWPFFLVRYLAMPTAWGLNWDLHCFNTCSVSEIFLCRTLAVLKIHYFCSSDFLTEKTEFRQFWKSSLNTMASNSLTAILELGNRNKLLIRKKLENI